VTSGGQAPRGPRRDPERGDLIGGHRIERPIGAGAMGTVWLAEHVTLGRRVALKILAHGLADDPSFQERFMREARLAARLEHPNVVAVYDAGTDPAGLWLSMRYVEGEDLRRRLRRLAAARGVAPGAAAGPRSLSSSPFRRPSADGRRNGLDDSVRGPATVPRATPRASASRCSRRRRSSPST
jgi:serine/threonine protein kinase